MYKSHDAVWCSFVVAYVDNQPTVTVSTDDHDVQANLTSHYTEFIKSTGIPPIL